jgi:septum formation protein
MVPGFILASASSARYQLLKTAGIQAHVRPSQFDESSVLMTEPQKLVQALAYEKAQAVAQQYVDEALILGCDSVLALQGKIYGKPKNSQEAIARWREMRGCTGDLHTGHALIDLSQTKTIVRCQTTQVQFAQVSDRQIEAYIKTGEPIHCAGCFALDGKGGLFIEGIVGCHSNVIGLSLPMLRQMLEELGYDITDFWQSNA